MTETSTPNSQTKNTAVNKKATLMWNFQKPQNPHQNTLLYQILFDEKNAKIKTKTLKTTFQPLPQQQKNTSLKIKKKTPKRCTSTMATADGISLGRALWSLGRFSVPVCQKVVFFLVFGLFDLSFLDAYYHFFISFGLFLYCFPLLIRRLRDIMVSLSFYFFLYMSCLDIFIFVSGYIHSFMWSIYWWICWFINLIGSFFIICICS